MYRVFWLSVEIMQKLKIKSTSYIRIINMWKKYWFNILNIMFLNKFIRNNQFSFSGIKFFINKFVVVNTIYNQSLILNTQYKRIIYIINQELHLTTINKVQYVYRFVVTANNNHWYRIIRINLSNLIFFPKNNFILA